jgi:hypothetical protein
MNRTSLEISDKELVDLEGEIEIIRQRAAADRFFKDGLSDEDNYL